MLTFDGITKTISYSGVTIISVRDLWSRWVDWLAISDNSKYLIAFESVGGNPIDESAGTYIPIYAFLANGWRINLAELDHTLTINDGVLLVSGGGDPFNNPAGAFTANVRYSQPVQAISFSTTGGTGLTKEEIADEVMSRDVATKLDLYQL